MRRKEKEITDKKEIEQIFKEALICRLGLVDGKTPYIVPMNYGYRNNILYFHSALSGRKIDILKKNPNVCFEIDISGGLKESDKACSWSMNYRSVMGEGRVQFIKDTSEKIDAFNIIMNQYSEKANWEFKEKMFEKTIIFKVKTDNISAKRSGMV
ncbi:MAG: pyridoxamine 5'-phosphate oxidase family protein [Spirochaetales bacterium]|nr:pyridoxamine 5'-phosphate oxidase family protein [Spirochaetales bacterium]